MSSRYALLFPGQGSQYAGMGRQVFDRYPEARAIFHRADEALGFDLSRLCLRGPEEELLLTANTQPAILTVSIAVYEVLAKAGIRPSFAAGHSLGEYSALVAARSISFEDAVRLVRARGELMQSAVPLGEGAMAAILGLPAAAAEEVCQEAGDGEVCAPANYNTPSQVVIAGTSRAVGRAGPIARRRGARKTVLLDVSAPFHCDLMLPAQERLAPMLDEIEFRNPEFAVACNVDARLIWTGAEARTALERQVTRPVRWEQSMRLLMASGASIFIEVGPGRTLTGLLRHIDRRAMIFNTDPLEHLDKALSLLAGMVEEAHGSGTYG